jgi:hypothetical protein
MVRSANPGTEGRSATKESLKMLAPFSARHRRGVAPINESFPGSARVALIHLLGRAIELDYISGWPSLLNELERIARVPRPAEANMPPPPS